MLLEQSALTFASLQDKPKPWRFSVRVVDSPSIKFSKKLLFKIHLVPSDIKNVFHSKSSDSKEFHHQNDNEFNVFMFLKLF